MTKITIDTDKLQELCQAILADVDSDGNGDKTKNVTLIMLAAQHLGYCQGYDKGFIDGANVVMKNHSSLMDKA